MSKQKACSISKDFPLYHSDIIPIYQSNKIIPKGKKTIFSNNYTNEHPDFLKLDCMKEKGYRNPYLDEVIKVDRSEEFKKFENNKQRLELIDYLKSNRKYSQDPSKLKYIQSELDIEMYKKRKKMYLNEYKNKENDNNNKYVTTDPSDKNYYTIINELNRFAPKVHYQNMQYRKKDFKNEKNNLNEQKYIITEENVEKLKKLKSDFEPNKSSYITNCNDYKISEAASRDKNRELTFKRNDFIKCNIITGKKEKIKLPSEINEKWSKFYENYFLMMNKSCGFRLKGGLFTEFSNKNYGSINVNKNKNILMKKFIQEKKYNSCDKRKSNGNNFMVHNYTYKKNI